MRALLVLAVCAAVIVAGPSVELRLGSTLPAGALAPLGCEPRLRGPGGPHSIDPVTLADRVGDAAPVQSPGRDVWIVGSGTVDRGGTALARQVDGSAATFASAPTGTWFVDLVAAPLPSAPTCDTERRRPADPVYVLVASGGQWARSPGQPGPQAGPGSPNVAVAAFSPDGDELWTAAVPARVGYYPDPMGFHALRPAAALSPDRRTIAVISSELDGSDRLSVIDVDTRQVRTFTLFEDRPALRLGPLMAAAKMLEVRGDWSPRFLDDRYLYAVLHETHIDDLGRLGVVLIDTSNGRLVARWPGSASILDEVRAQPVDWTVAAGSLYLVTRDLSPTTPYTLYRLNARDLHVEARRAFEATQLLEVSRP